MSAQKIFFIFLFIRFIQLSQCCMPAVYKYVDRDIDLVSNRAKYPWLVVVKDHDETNAVYRLGYGAAIHPRVVITAALGLQGHIQTHLIVQINCEEDNIQPLSEVNCLSRYVTNIIYPDNFDGVTVFEHYYAILILEYSLYKDASHVKSISLASNYDVFDQNNCFYTRWMRVLSTTQNRTAIIKEQYRTSFYNAVHNADTFDREKLKVDRDYFMSNAFHSSVRNKDINPINYMGSPLVCLHKQRNDIHVLVGLATFRFRVYLTSDGKEVLKIDREGSFINLIPYYEEIMNKYTNLTLV